MTAYDQLHSFGIDLGPYTRLYARAAQLLRGEAVDDPQPATFRDGVTNMALVDAIRRSAAGAGWVEPDA